MDVQLLGPVAVVEGDRTLTVRQRRQRALLALLALRSGETLAVDRLVEELWGAEAPKTAVASLHNAVSQLRKQLGPETVVRREPGYALDAERVSVDADRFEHLLAEARAARSMRDEQTAAAILREALGLWRGPALADLAYEPFAQAEIRRLEELRQGALEERIDADLALGRHGDLVPELETLVAQEPLRERLHGQLMLALYRAERQADALAAYRGARSTLVEELGIEPGPELRQLHAAILRQDESLLLAGAAPTAPRASMQFRRLATILVAEVVVSSETEELDPEALHRLLERYHETVTAVVGGHGGAVERTAGDAVMAAFGVSAGDENPALRAARAAADLQAAVAGLNAHLEAMGTRLDPRVGIATGEVLVSGAGSRQQLVTGEAIGVAAALQQAAAPGEVVIGPLTRRLVGVAATVEPLGELELRSRSKPVPAFRLLGVSTEQPSFASLLDTPFVGRKRELRALRAALREARTERAVRAVCVLGPAGIGKSRLAREVSRGARGFDVLVGRCLSYGQGITYWPLRQVVGDDRDTIRAALADDPDADTVAERLAALDGPAPEIAWAFRRWCEARARRRAVLLMLDDLHWAEPTFLDLLEHLVEHGSGRIAVLGLARDELLEERPGFLDGRPSATRLALDGLGVAEAETLVEELLAGAPLPVDVRARVFETAEGNPLFVEQLVALAAEGDPIGAEQQLPATIQALLAARLDRLGPGERAVLERAAVVGREFTAAHVMAMLDPLAVPTAERHLESLTRRGFVEMRPDGGFRFRHVLLQEATYRAAPKRLRAELHEKLADRLEREDAADDALVGYHLERAYRLRTEVAPPDRAALRLAEDAGRRLGAAGIRAWQRHDAPAAGNLLGRAVDLLPADDVGRLELLCELGTVFKWSVDDRAEAVYREVADRAPRGDERLRLRAELDLAWPRFTRGEATTEEILDLAERARGVFESHRDERGLGRAWLITAAVHGPIRLQWQECEGAATRALENYRRAGFSPMPCFSLLQAALVCGPEPVRSAMPRCEALVASYRSDRSVDAHARIFFARLELMRGNVAAARTHLEASRRYVEEQGGSLSGDWLTASASTELVAGDSEAGSAILAGACESFERRGDRAWLATSIALLAEVRVAQGRFDEALELTSRATTLAPRDDLTAQSLWRRARAQALALRGDFGVAERLAREAVELLETTDGPSERGRTLLPLAEVLYLASRADDARMVADEATGLFERKGDVAALEGARARLGELDPVLAR